MSGLGSAGMGAHRHSGSGAMIAVLAIAALCCWSAVEHHALARLRAEVAALRQTAEDHALAERQGALSTHKQINTLKDDIAAVRKSAAHQSVDSKADEKYDSLKQTLSARLLALEGAQKELEAAVKQARQSVADHDELAQQLKQLAKQAQIHHDLTEAALNQQQQVIKQITASPTTSTTKAVADAAGDQGSSRDDATSKGRAAPPTDADQAVPSGGEEAAAAAATAQPKQANAGGVEGVLAEVEDEEQLLKKPRSKGAMLGDLEDIKATSDKVLGVKPDTAVSGSSSGIGSKSGGSKSSTDTTAAGTTGADGKTATTQSQSLAGQLDDATGGGALSEGASSTKTAGGSSTGSDTTGSSSSSRGSAGTGLITVDGEEDETDGGGVMTAGSKGLKTGGSSGPAHMMTKDEHDQHEVVNLLKVTSSRISSSTGGSSTGSTIGGTSAVRGGGISSLLQDEKAGAVAGAGSGAGGVMGTLSSATGAGAGSMLPNHGAHSSALGRKSGMGLTSDADA